MATNFISLANSGSYFRRELMKDDFVNIKFSSTSYAAYSKGTSLGQTYPDDGTGQSYELMEDYVPTYNTNTNGYDYDMVFKAWYYRLSNKIFCDISTGANPTYNSVEWTLTAAPSRFASVLQTNMRLVDEGCSVVMDSSIDTAVSFITCTFNGTSVLDAINTIVKALDPDTNYYEWWFEGKTLHIGKLAKGSTSQHSVALGTNVGSVSVQKSASKAITKLYAYSSDKNISTRYGKTAPTIVASSRLNDSDGNLIGYQDTNHVMLGSMFHSSARFYDNIASIKSSSYSIQHLTKFGQADKHVFPYTKNAQAYRTGTAIVRHNNSSFGVYLSNTESTRCQVTVSAHLVEINSNGETTATIGTFGSYQITLDAYQKNTCRVSLKEITFVADKTKSYGVEIRSYVGYWSSGYAYTGDAPEDKGVYLNYAANSIDNAIQSQNYAINAGSFGIFNPGFYPLTDPRSRCFSVPASGMPGNAIIGKLPYAWFSDNTSATDAVSQKRLSVIIGSGDVEGQMVFDNIYPSMAGTLPGTITYTTDEEEDSYGQKTGRVFCYYTFLCSFLSDVDESDFVEEKATIIFTDSSSVFYGKEFELKIIKSSSEGTTFAIIPNDNYGKLLPNVDQAPSGTYKIVGIEASYYESADIIQNALDELQAAANAYYTLVNIDTNIYSLKMLPVQGDGSAAQQVFPSFGDGITFADKSLTTRVIGVQHPLDLPEVDYNVIIGNSRSYKKIDNLETSLVNAKSAIDYVAATQTASSKAKAMAKVSGSSSTGSSSSATTYIEAALESKEEVYVGVDEPTDESVDIWVDTSNSSGGLTSLSINSDGHLIATTSESQGVLKTRINGSFVPVVMASSSGSGGGILSETDPIFAEHEAHKITASMIAVLGHLHYDATNERVYSDKDFYSQGGLSAYGYNGGSSQINVNVENVVSSGVEIAKINGKSIYAPNGGANVVWNQLQSTGVKIATIKIDDASPIDIYAPIGGETDLTAYATKVWVGQQGYLKDGDLSGYATQTWVGQNYLSTSHEANNITSDMIAVLGHLHYDATNQRLYVDKDFYSQGGISAYGYNGGSELSVNVQQTLTSGTEIAKINGTSIYAPNAGSNVVWNQSYTSGINIATIKIGNADPISVYAPVAGESPDLSGYATQQWVNTQGFLSSSDITEAMRSVLSHLFIDADGNLKTDLNFYSEKGVSAYGYNGGSELVVNVQQIITSSNGVEIAKINGSSVYAPKSIEGAATESWVGQQGFLTSASLSGYATESWVGQNYLSKSGGVVSEYIQIDANKGIKLTGSTSTSHDEDETYMPWYGLAFLKPDPTQSAITHLAGYGGICLHTDTTKYVELFGHNKTPGHLKIGDAVITYDSTNKALKIYSATTGEIVNLYVTGGITAYK